MNLSVVLDLKFLCDCGNTVGNSDPLEVKQRQRHEATQQLAARDRRAGQQKRALPEIVKEQGGNRETQRPLNHDVRTACSKDGEMV
jgi:hypothetical protein